MTLSHVFLKRALFEDKLLIAFQGHQGMKAIAFVGSVEYQFLLEYFRGTKATTRGHGGNCLYWLHESVSTGALQGHQVSDQGAWRQWPLLAP